MKVSTWTMTILLGASLALGQGTTEVSTNTTECNVQVTTTNLPTAKFPMRSEELWIWFKAVEGSNANISIKEDSGEERSFHKTWRVNNIDRWLHLHVKEGNEETQANLQIEVEKLNGEYIGFERFSSVELSSKGMVMWSTCDVSSCPVCPIPPESPPTQSLEDCPTTSPEETPEGSDSDDDSTTLKKFLSDNYIYVGAAFLFLIMVIIVLSICLIRSKRQCKMQANAKPARPEVLPLPVVEEPDNPANHIYDEWNESFMNASRGHLSVPPSPSNVPSPPTENPESEYAEWDESFMEKCRGAVPEPPSSSQVLPTRRPGSSHESLNSIYGTIIPE